MAETFNTVPKVLHHWATHEPDTAAFIFVDSARKRRVLTRADVYRLAGRFAAILRRDGVRRGDVVCNTLPNSPERVVSDFGIMMAGATGMNGQIFLADGADFLGSLKDSQCTAIILDPLQPKGAAWLLESLEKEECSDGTIHVAQLPALCRIFPCYWQSLGEVSNFLDMLEQHQDSYVAEVAPEDLACIWTTSGSTGFSKLVPQSHSHLLQLSLKFSLPYGLYQISEPNDTTGEAKTETGPLKTSTPPLADDSNKKNMAKAGVEISPQSDSRSSKEDPEARTGQPVTSYAKHVLFNNGSLGWSGGFPSGYLTAGVTRVVLDLSRGSPPDPVAHVWTVICQERCKFGLMLPFYLQEILSRELWRDLPWKLSMLGVGGQPVHASLLKKAIGHVTDAITVRYGSSEFGVLTKITVLDAEQYEDCNNGKPFPGVEVKVINNEDKVVERGQMGQVIVRTSTPFLGYVNNEEATKKITLQDGWFRTGDVGYFTDSGDLCVICRTSFTIMRGAFLLHPGWLEARISTHPAVQSVLVVPVPDPVLHQELCACVVTKPEASVTAEELREFCRTLFLTDSGDHMTAVPPYFLFFSALPTNATGKPCRHTTSKTAQQQLGL